MSSTWEPSTCWSRGRRAATGGHQPRPDGRARPLRNSSPSSPSHSGQVTIETLAPSPVSRGEIWVGTSNGVIQLTRDGGETGRTSRRPACHKEAVAGARSSSVARQRRHRLRGGRGIRRRPSRTSIEHATSARTGSSSSGACRRTRRPSRAGGSRGSGSAVRGYRNGRSWVSFDRGDHWQSLQLNLPNTRDQDIVVHGVDLAISTYGRALWILDDVTPLRELRSGRGEYVAWHTCSSPATAYRVRWDNIQDTPLPPEVPAGDNPPEGAIIDYYLKTAAAGPSRCRSTMRTTTSSATTRAWRRPRTLAPNIAAYWFAPPIVLPTAAGMHRMAWDLRYPVPTALNYSYFGDLLDYTEYTLNTHAIKGHTPRINPPARWSSRAPSTSADVGGETYTRELRSWTIHASRSHRQAALQLRLELRMMAGMAVSFDAFNSSSSFDRRSPQDEGAAAAPRSAQVLTALKARHRASRWPSAGRQWLRSRQPRPHSPSRRIWSSGTYRPRRAIWRQPSRIAERIDSALVGLQQLETTDIPKLNAMLPTPT